VSKLAEIRARHGSKPEDFMPTVYKDRAVLLDLVTRMRPYIEFYFETGAWATEEEEQALAALLEETKE
jgi:hypothetical protein